MGNLRILGFIVFFISSAVFAQKDFNAFRDSLEKDLINYRARDTIRVMKIIRYNMYLGAIEPNKAIELAEEGIKLSKELNWAYGESGLLLCIANAEGFEERYDKSVIAAFKALEIAENHKIKYSALNAHAILSSTYTQMKNDSLAIFHARKYLDIATGLKRKSDIIFAMTMLGETYATTGQWEKADPILAEALNLAIEEKNEYIQDRILLNYIEKAESQEDFSKALELSKKSLAYQLKIGEYHGIAYSYTRLGKYFSALNMKDSALFYAHKALQLSKEENLTKELKDAYEVLFISHRNFGNYKEALDYRLMYDSIYNQVNSLAAGEKAEKARAELEQQRKDDVIKVEITKKEAASKRMRIIFYSIILFFIIIGGIFGWAYRQKQKAKTKIEKAYSELKSTQAQLIHSEKMASLGELTAGIAHEIQNPLNFVNNFSELNTELLEELDVEVTKGNMTEIKVLAKDIKANEEKINHHGKRAGDIVKGMLQHSRGSSGTKEPTDINALADEYLRLAYHGLRAKDKGFNATMKTDFDPNGRNLNIVPQDMGRVILNLITNAFYAVNERKQQHPEGYEPTVSVGTKKKGDNIEISVKDNGNGIPQKILDKIFQPFFTTKPTGQGTGLGLSLAYDIVKAHGGQLKVGTKEGEYSLFVINLPY